MIRHAAVTNHSSVPDRDIAFVVEALRQQAVDFCTAYGLPVPGVQFYSRDVELPSTEAFILSAVDDDGNPDTAGYHTSLAGTPLALFEARGWAGQVVASHELLETIANPALERWVSGWWYEVCDPVEACSYAVDVELFGQHRRVSLSNYVLPSFWHPRSPGPWDRMGLLTGPLSVAPGGYAILEGGRELGASLRAKGAGSRTAKIRERLSEQSAARR